MAVTCGSDTALTTQTGIDNATEEFIGTIDLSGALSAYIQLEIDNESGSVTDAVIISIYGTNLDDSSRWDTAPYQTFTIKPSVITVERHPLVVSGIYRFRIGVLSAGATDTYAVGGDYKVRTA